MNTEILLISRFNLPITFAKEKQGRDKMGNPPLGLIWLNRRREYFLRITKVSVLEQRMSAFKWYVLFHPETDRRFVDSLGHGFIPIFGTDMRDCLDQIRRSMQLKYGSTEQIFVSLRLDTDDAIGQRYLQMIDSFFHQTLFRVHDTDRIALIYRKGVFHNIQTNEVKEKDYPNNPFSALGELVPASEIKSIYCVDHSKVSQTFTTFSMESKDFQGTWRISVHETNVGNVMPTEKV